MLGRQRRVRVLSILVCIAIVFFLYHRNAPTASEYAEYVREKTVGGGSVLRQKEENLHQAQAPLRSPAIAAHGQQTTTALKAQPTVPPTYPEDSEGDGLNDEDSLFYSDLTNDQMPVEVGEGHNEHSITSHSTTKAPTHWTRPAEQFPVGTTIQLPTGTPKSIPRIQHSGGGKADTERLNAIKKATRHAWNGYISVALGFDEVKPVSGEAKNSFNGWGATLVDSLDTLWIMGLTKEFEQGVEQVKKIDFSSSSRGDIPLFEVTIRYLGGLLAAYDVSKGKYRVLLDKAVELGDILYGAFDTANRMPITYYHWMPGYASQPHRASPHTVLAEIGTLSLEFTRLAQITGEPKYYDAIARITDAFEEWQNRTRLPGMWPTYVDASGCRSPVQTPSVLKNFREQLMPDSNDRLMAAGPPVFYDGKLKHDTTGSSSKTGEKASLKQVHALADKSSFADDVRDLSADETIMRKRQLSSDDDEEEEEEEEDSPTNPSFQDDDTAVEERDEEDTSTGERVCLHAGLNSSSYGGVETFTLGGMSDSVYEYLPKEYLLLGGQLDQYKDMYLYSIETIIDKLLFRPMTPQNYDILFTGDMSVSTSYSSEANTESRQYKSEHLSCFVGGMFGMGGKIFNKPEHVEIARRLTDGCIWAYNSTASGIMPESFVLMPCTNMKNCKYNQTAYFEKLDPLAGSRTSDPELFRKKVYYTSTAQATKSKIYSKTVPTPSHTRSAKGYGKGQTSRLATTPSDTDEGQERTIRKRQLNDTSLDERMATNTTAAPRVATIPDPSHPARLQHKGSNTYQPSRTTPITDDDGEYLTSDDDDQTEEQPFYYKQETQEEYVNARIKSERLPPGFVSLSSTAYILRPEAIESVFYMYRITGEQHWRDAGWRMFQAVEQATHAQYGHSAIHDVTKAKPMQTNQMESFWIAETLKYFYLLFDEPDTWSLDDWVLNTEAHFFQRPKGTSSEA